jgi:thiol-disulfide isomerase/thioredoxin
MMKILALSFLTALTFATALGQGKKEDGDMTIHGQLSPNGDLLYADSITLRFSYDSKATILKTAVQKGHFQFQLKSIPEGAKAVLILHHTRRDSTAKNFKTYDVSRNFLTEHAPLEVSVVHQMRDASISGGRQNAAFDIYHKSTSPLYERMEELRAIMFKKQIDSVYYRRQMSICQKEIETRKLTFIKEHTYSWLALDLLGVEIKNYLANRWVKDPSGHKIGYYRDLFVALDPALRERGKIFLANLDNADSNEVINFKGELANGNFFDTKSLKGKVYLIDFWGSWCVWCRKGHPHLKELYARYKNKGFEIVGVGNEMPASRPEQWRKFSDAISKDGLPWPQILNDRSTNDLAAVYAVNSYPSKFLVNSEGKIILRIGDDKERRLDAKLAELLDE